MSLFECRKQLVLKMVVFVSCWALISISNVEHSSFPSYRIGLDLVNGKPRDNRQAGVYEPTMVKTKSLKFATEAAITILRIDDMIKLFPEPKEGGGYQEAMQSGSLEG